MADEIGIGNLVFEKDKKYLEKAQQRKSNNENEEITKTGTIYTILVGIAFTALINYILNSNKKNQPVQKYYETKDAELFIKQNPNHPLVLQLNKQLALGSISDQKNIHWEEAIDSIKKLQSIQKATKDSLLKEANATYAGIKSIAKNPE